MWRTYHCTEFSDTQTRERRHPLSRRSPLHTAHRVALTTATALSLGPVYCRRLYHRQIGARKALDHFGYGIIAPVESLDVFVRTRPDAARTVLSAIKTAQSRYGLFPIDSSSAAKPLPVVVGLSGGADSVCLLHSLSLLAPYWNLALHAVHVDHGLREESVGDAEFAAGFAARLKIPFHLCRLDGQEFLSDPRGLEGAARAKRYRCLTSIACKVASDLAPPVVAVAHHMHDQAETVLMNLVRGAGLNGLGGMSHVRPIDATEYDSHMSDTENSVRLVRPLLDVGRESISAYLKAFELPYREDSTNANTAFLRNRIRHETLPTLAELNTAIVETLARTADLLRAEFVRSEALDRSSLDDLTIDACPPQRYVLDLDRFSTLDLAAQRGVLRLTCARMGMDLRDLGFDNVESVLWALRANDQVQGPHTLAAGVQWSALPFNSHLPALLSLHRHNALPWQPSHPLLIDLHTGVELPLPIQEQGTQVVSAKWTLETSVLSPDEMPSDWRANLNPWRAFLDADFVQVPALTVPATGMRVAPLGMAGRSKNLGDYFTDRKTPHYLRAYWPIVVDTNDGTVVWICGHTINHAARITEQTRRVLCLEWRPVEGTEAPVPSKERVCAPT
jgi:tRNA(Ile)-lysidine synthase